MNCTLLDLACHAQGAAWEWWAGVGWLNKALIVAGLLAVILGISWSFLSMLKRIGGWPAVIGAVAVIVGLVLALLPRRPAREPIENVDGDDAAPPPKKPKRRKTLQDLFSDGLR